MLMCICATSLSLSSCSKDGDNDDDGLESTFSILYSLVDSEELKPEEAATLIYKLNHDTALSRVWYTDQKHAIREYDNLIIDIKRGVTLSGNGSGSITFNCDLVKDNQTTIKRTVLKLTHSGCYDK